MCTIDDPAGVYSERTLKARKEVHGMQPSDYAGEKYSYVFSDLGRFTIRMPYVRTLHGRSALASQEL